MNDGLDRLASLYGVEDSYISEAGQRRTVSAEAKRGVLAAMGVAAETEEEVARSIATAPPTSRAWTVAAAARCYLPSWIEDTRCWGIVCQLYGLQSARNLGIGDFEDLARLAELAGRAGADFLGVNPLHALFLADPLRFSPYSPSHRQMLNPLYIATDRLEGAGRAEEAERLRSAPLVDYGGVAAAKRRQLEGAFRQFEHTHSGAGEFGKYRRKRGATLREFALFETLSEHFVSRGLSAGWHGWPAPFRDRGGEAVRQFEAANENRIRFQEWLQWVAERQLQEVQARARAAGMRIGLYLDLAVGVEPDGAATWSDPRLVTPGARIGTPPDLFNARGQDWGLAPLSPARLVEHSIEPFARLADDLMRHAGAVRIDHAMALTRLWWIPQKHAAIDGAYVRYPMAAMLRALADASHRCRTIVVGEALGTVPEGFRESMQRARILSYRVLYFERTGEGRFLAPECYPADALVCISTHDLPTLRGWWRGADIDLRERAQRVDPQLSARRRKDRARERRLLLGALALKGLLPERLLSAAEGRAEFPADADAELLVAVHRFLAKSPARLLAVQVEDMVGMVDQANLPGTVHEHPNWQRKLPVRLEDLEAHDGFIAVAGALRDERPK